MIAEKDLEVLETLVDEYQKSYEELAAHEKELTLITEKIKSTSKVLKNIRKRENLKIDEIALSLKIPRAKVSEMILKIMSK